MTLLITGGMGFIGSALVRQALAADHQVVNLDALTYAATPATLADIAVHPRYHFVQADLRNSAVLDPVFDRYQPHAVLHLAAESHVDRSITRPADFLTTNITGTFHLLEAARRHWHQQGCPEGFRFLHVSTDEVFGSLGPSGTFCEASNYAPNSPYSASKAAADHLVRAWGATYDLPVLLTNCSNNYGPYQFPEKLIPQTILRALAGRPIPIYGDGRQIRDWLFVDDHAAALLAVLRHGSVGRSYAIGARSEQTNLALVQQLCALIDHMQPRTTPSSDLIHLVADRPGHDARYAINPTRIENELGWAAQTSLREGLTRTVRWYLDHRDWWEPLWTQVADPEWGQAA